MRDVMWLNGVMTEMSLQSGAREDARYQRDHGGAITAAEARARARERLNAGRVQSADYWSAYAAEVESWED